MECLSHTLDYFTTLVSPCQLLCQDEYYCPRQAALIDFTDVLARNKLSSLTDVADLMTLYQFKNLVKYIMVKALIS